MRTRRARTALRRTIATACSCVGPHLTRAPMTHGSYHSRARHDCSTLPCVVPAAPLRLIAIVRFLHATIDQFPDAPRELGAYDAMFEGASGETCSHPCVDALTEYKNGCRHGYGRCLRK